MHAHAGPGQGTSAVVQSPSGMQVCGADAAVSVAACKRPVLPPSSQHRLRLPLQWCPAVYTFFIAADLTPEGASECLSPQLSPIHRDPKLPLSGSALSAGACSGVYTRTSMRHGMLVLAGSAAWHRLFLLRLRRRRPRHLEVCQGVLLCNPYQPPSLAAVPAPWHPLTPCAGQAALSVALASCLPYFAVGAGRTPWPATSSAAGSLRPGKHVLLLPLAGADSHHLSACHGLSLH